MRESNGCKEKGKRRERERERGGGRVLMVDTCVLNEGFNSILWHYITPYQYYVKHIKMKNIFVRML